MCDRVWVFFTYIFAAVTNGYYFFKKKKIANLTFASVKVEISYTLSFLYEHIL